MNVIKDTPWDTVAFGMHTAEITEYSAASLARAILMPGHYSIKINPLDDKRLLHGHGFYYCDTLIEPYCTTANFARVEHADASISTKIDLDMLLSISHGAFHYGRFHRDFAIDKERADLRYDNWLRQLYKQAAVYGLCWQGELQGFIACDSNNLILHAVAQAQRGKGRAKYWWSLVSEEILAAGHSEVRSSISAANLAAVNLYAGLGFSFRRAQDVYHKLVEE